jgi:hypothetical protein
MAQSVWRHEHRFGRARTRRSHSQAIQPTTRLAPAAYQNGNLATCASSNPVNTYESVCGQAMAKSADVELAKLDPLLRAAQRHLDYKKELVGGQRRRARRSFPAPGTSGW